MIEIELFHLFPISRQLDAIRILHTAQMILRKTVVTVQTILLIIMNIKLLTKIRQTRFHMIVAIFSLFSSTIDNDEFFLQDFPNRTILKAVDNIRSERCFCFLFFFSVSR